MEDIDRYSGRVVQGSGYGVKTVTQLQALRYTRGDQTLSLDAELVDRTREFGRSWLILPTYALAITLPRVLQWDNGVIVDPDEVDMIREEISAALDQDGQRHFFEIAEETDWISRKTAEASQSAVSDRPRLAKIAERLGYCEPVRTRRLAIARLSRKARKAYLTLLLRDFEGQGELDAALLVVLLPSAKEPTHSYFPDRVALLDENEKRAVAQFWHWVQSENPGGFMESFGDKSRYGMEAYWNQWLSAPRRAKDRRAEQ